MDKFAPISGGCDVDRAEEDVGELVVAGGDGAVALLVERPVMFDLPFCKVGTDCVGIVTLIGEQSVWCSLGQVDQGVRGFAVSRLADRQMEGEWSSEGIGQTVSLLVTPPRERPRVRHGKVGKDIAIQDFAIWRHGRRGGPASS